jgi:hypothetical protein
MILPSSCKKYILDTYNTHIGGEDKKGIIILTDNRINPEVNLDSIDIVVLLDNTETVDERLQRINRVMTPDPGKDIINKRAGYVIDMDFSKTLSTLLDYQKINDYYNNYMNISYN